MVRDARSLVGGESRSLCSPSRRTLLDSSICPLRLVHLGSERQTADVAARLYAALRECDDLGADAVLARIVTTQHALSAAVRDRLARAATRIVQSGADL